MMLEARRETTLAIQEDKTIKMLKSQFMMDSQGDSGNLMMEPKGRESSTDQSNTMSFTSISNTSQ